MITRILTLKDFVEDCLTRDGYDGLANSYLECGCPLDDLMPCGTPTPACVTGHIIPCECGKDGCIGQGCGGSGWKVIPGRKEAKP